MPFAAVTNYAQFGVERNREIMKYFAEYNTAHRSVSYGSARMDYNTSLYESETYLMFSLPPL
jgi:hypothetical protein